MVFILFILGKLLLQTIFYMEAGRIPKGRWGWGLPAPSPKGRCLYPVKGMLKLGLCSSKTPPTVAVKAWVRTDLVLWVSGRAGPGIPPPGPSTLRPQTSESG